jgi:hypothetical protein
LVISWYQRTKAFFVVGFSRPFFAMLAVLAMLARKPWLDGPLFALI